MTRCRILIADYHDVVRRSVRTVLDELLPSTVVGEATTGPEALAKTIALHPDIVVLDISLPDLNGIEVTREIARIAPTVDVVVLTMHTSRRLARLLHDAGASGYIAKMELGRKLVDLIQRLVERRAVLRGRHPLLLGRDFERSAMDRAAVDAELTVREREVLRLLAEGNTNKEIGSALAISAKTVETHRARIMSKLQVRSVGQLVRFAIRQRIISP